MTKDRIESSAWGWVALAAGLVLAAAVALAAPAAAQTGTPEAKKNDDRERVERKVVVKAPRARVVVVPEGSGKGSFLGVQTEEETKSSEGGARIVHVAPDSPAAQAGLEEGDVIVGIDGQVVRGPARLAELIAAGEPGSEVSIRLLRDGRERTVKAKLGERPRAWAFGAPEHHFEFTVPEVDLSRIEEHMRHLEERMPELHEHLRKMEIEIPDMEKVRVLRLRPDRPRLGIETVNTTPELRQHLGGGKDAGVLVGRVLEGSPAEKAGVRVGDLIVSVDGKAVGRSLEIAAALGEKAGQTVEIEVLRDRRTLTLRAELPEAGEGEVEWLERPAAAPAPPAAPRAPLPPRGTVESGVAPAPPAPPAPPPVPWPGLIEA